MMLVNRRLVANPSCSGLRSYDRSHPYRHGHEFTPTREILKTHVQEKSIHSVQPLLHSAFYGARGVGINSKVRA
jgi:hypothetical protein